jgi:hypothetical protein
MVGYLFVGHNMNKININNITRNHLIWLHEITTDKVIRDNDITLTVINFNKIIISRNMDYENIREPLYKQLENITSSDYLYLDGFVSFIHFYHKTDNPMYYRLCGDIIIYLTEHDKGVALHATDIDKEFLRNTIPRLFELNRFYKHDR